MTKDYYLRAFEKIKRHIYDGDVYQINFSQRFDCEYHARPIDLFHWQNRYNPSPYSAYIDAGDFQIVSASPEMFITVKDRIISTKPIKGTRKRIEETSAKARQINAENFQQLLNSEKEKAELNMIIDLERNDVARICKPGTRKVTQPRTIETCPTVFHAVATVAGELRDDVDFCDILKAMFPGGSITGAPKIRSMQIINETEPTARGIYTGSIGYIGLDGSICLNIAIRTIIIKNKTAYVQTGGGIVADSDPQAEYDETITKARALLAGIAAVNQLMSEKVFLNDKLVDIEDARISVGDGGFLYGAGLFETMRAYNGVVFRLDDHLDRLLASTKALSIEHTYNKEYLTDAVHKVLEANKLADARLRLTLSAGAMSQSQEKPIATLLITAAKLQPYPAEYYKKGVLVVLCPFRQNVTATRPAGTRRQAICRVCWR